MFFFSLTCFFFFWLFVCYLLFLLFVCLLYPFSFHLFFLVIFSLINSSIKKKIYFPHSVIPHNLPLYSFIYLHFVFFFLQPSIFLATHQLSTSNFPIFFIFLFSSAHVSHKFLSIRLFLHSYIHPFSSSLVLPSFVSIYLSSQFRSILCLQPSNYFFSSLLSHNFYLSFYLNSHWRFSTFVPHKDLSIFPLFISVYFYSPPAPPSLILIFFTLTCFLHNLSFFFSFLIYPIFSSLLSYNL